MTVHAESKVVENCHAVMHRIREASTCCGRRPDEVKLVVVSKTRPASMIREATGAGMTVFGENYIQEAKPKIADISDPGLTWHFIGHLQSNKAKTAVKLFDLIHTVDSFKLAREIDKQAGKISKRQEVLIQINIGEEASKSGVSGKKALALIKEISSFDHLSVQGLMAMPPYSADPEQTRPFFRALFQLSRTIRQAGIPGVSMEALSMGMTRDFEVAIEEGATLVRVGTAIFGER